MAKPEIMPSGMEAFDVFPGERYLFNSSFASFLYSASHDLVLLTKVWRFRLGV
jgi:hypothetical protein